LELPQQSTELRAVELGSAERAVLTCLEGMSRRLHEAGGALSNHHHGSSSSTTVQRREDRDRAGRVDLLLRLIRCVCISPAILNGGAGCKSELPKLNRLLRDLLGAGVAPLAHDIVVGEKTIRKMAAADAYDAVMRAETLQAVVGDL
jgi:hypothetical protein